MRTENHSKISASQFFPDNEFDGSLWPHGFSDASDGIEDN